MSDDALLELDEDPHRPEDDEGGPVEPWRILIVDDDEQVHRVTRFALEGRRVLGRPLNFDSAYSAEQARSLLAAGRYSCILLDVVMETEDAGLKLVGEIRERYEDPAVRIVLRTGQPGYAPEIEVIQNYDINDYRAKSELTSQRLLTTLTAALRSFQQIRTIEANRQGLSMIVDAASSLMAVRAVRSLAEGVLTQICAMLHVEADGLVCAQLRDGAEEEPKVLAASGRHAGLQGQVLSALRDPPLQQRIESALREERSDYARDHALLYIRSPRAGKLVVHVPTGNPISELDRRLLELFSINVAVGLDNARLFEELETMAFHDPLTGCWNRASLERELARRCALDRPFTLALADIDGFQAVNDGLGHEVGDRTLKLCALLLGECLGEAGFVARISADSFGLLVEPADAADRILRSLSARLARNLEVDGHEIPVTMTLGLARYPEHGTTAPALFRNAGIALKQAKRAHRSGWQYFDGRFESALQQRLETIGKLRRAVDEGSLRLLYQPLLELSDRRVFGVEALLRWQRPDGEWVLPEQFIPAAEESGLIVELGQWVLREACRQAAAWRRAGLELKLAVNISPRQLRDPEFGSIVRSALADAGLPAQALEIEVTESLLIGDASGGPLDTLAALRADGIGIAIDDFGTGHSSLSRLQRLPIDRLKIDRSFVTGLVQRDEDRIIAEMIVNLGHLLGLKVLAEGVETEAQAGLLAEIGCDEVQGFLFGPPQSAAAIEARLHGER